MNQNSFSSVTTDEMLTAFRSGLFNNTLDLIRSGVQLLKPVTDGANDIVDYEILYSNGKALPPGATLRSHAVPGLKEKLVQPDTEESFGLETESEGRHQNFIYTVTRLSDGILLTHDESTEKISGDLRDHSHLLENLTRAIPDILFVMNLHTREVVFINRSMQRSLGYTDEQIDKMPEPFFDVICEEDLPKVLNHLEEMKTARLNEVKEITYRMKDSSGRLRWFRDRNTIFKTDEHGKAKEKTGVVRDISGEKETEEHIIGLNKALSLKNSALESMHSEIKTLNDVASTDYKKTLQKLYTNLEFILANDARNLSDTGKANLRKMQASIQKMKLLTDDIISFSKLQTLDEVPANVDLNQIIRIAKKDLAEKIEESESTIRSDDLPVISGFPLLLSLLFFHLLDNAIKFRNEETLPDINIFYTAVNGMQHVNRQDAGMPYHRVTVQDNGIGFDEGESDKLFAMFYRSEGKKKFKGSGIGLSICRKIMALHNGYIFAESTEAGASFHCFFPS